MVWVRFGAVAQLGERLLCKQEVVGSIPSGSTISVAGQTVPDAAPQRSSGLSKDKNFAAMPPDGRFGRDAIGHREYVFGF